VAAAHLTVEESRTSSDTVLALTGEIDMATAGELKAAADRSLLEPSSRVVLDFAGVTFCDSQGLSTLISLNRQASAAGSQLVLANIGDFMGRLLEITGLRTVFEVEDQPAV
jgi:anti-sigma B factor antagonist